jgi:hypothetical protein
MGLLVAVFNQRSEWPGGTITYEDARHQFILPDGRPISAQALLGLDGQGQLDWADESLRAWTRGAAQATSAAAPAGGSPGPAGAAASGQSVRRTAAHGPAGGEVLTAPASTDSADGLAEPGPASPSHPALAEAGFVCSLFGLGVPLLGVLGLVLSVAARRQAERLGTPKGLATAGIVIGVIGTVVGLLLLLVALVG